ncbi:MAG: hypothetical protein LBC63_00340 [Holophagales bacterium]|jgi:hypothetical protein|nr:hypothetical protein [Holophagales bacterium]
MLMSIQDASKLIEGGRRLAIAGDEALLSKLPKGNWIGGTTSYFMTDGGGVVTREQIFVQDLTDSSTGGSIKQYPASDLPNIAKDAPEHGFSIIVIPAFSEAHFAYAQNAPNYEGIFMKPIVGWISGVHLDDFGKAAPKVFNGATGAFSDKDAIVFHFTTAEGKTATVHILSLFEPGDGDTITFEEEGFTVLDCFVNGEKQNFHDYIKNKNIDTKLPLVADYCGAKVNVSYQGIRPSDGAVMMYAPVFKDVKYKIAAPVSDPVSAFKKIAPKDLAQPVFACNCVLNFLYLGLEGKIVEKANGPITFGEIAYQLVNQTRVSLEVK